MPAKRRYSIRYLLVAVWVIFTVSLSAWWVFFGLEQIERLKSLGYAHDADLVRYQKMLIYEGGTLLVSLFVGGATLAYYMYREVKQADQLKNFFLAFTHDTKTALAAAQLQAEMLKERVQDDKSQSIATRLLEDLERLGLQLENSLYVADIDKRRLHTERILLPELLSQLAARFPALSITYPDKGWVLSDVRAVESICTNLIHNAMAHGGARNITVSITQPSTEKLVATFTDDGKGFSGDRKKLGQIFFRHYTGSGSGLGLYLARSLAHAMGGSLQFPQPSSGFQAVLTLPGGVV